MSEKTIDYISRMTKCSIEQATILESAIYAQLMPNNEILDLLIKEIKIESITVDKIIHFLSKGYQIDRILMNVKFLGN